MHYYACTIKLSKLLVLRAAKLSNPLPLSYVAEYLSNGLIDSFINSHGSNKCRFFALFGQMVLRKVSIILYFKEKSFSTSITDYYFHAMSKVCLYSSLNVVGFIKLLFHEYSYPCLFHIAFLKQI